MMHLSHHFIRAQFQLHKVIWDAVSSIGRLMLNVVIIWKLFSTQLHTALHDKQLSP